MAGRDRDRENCRERMMVERGREGSSMGKYTKREGE